MNSETIIMPIMTFLLGLTASGWLYTWRFSERLARVETTLQNIQKKVAEPVAFCSAHAEISNETGRQDERIRNLEKKIEGKI